MVFRITSRKYYNFTNDAHREGATIKPFTEKQSWDLLMKLLGPEWVEQDRKGLIKGSEEKAATDMLRHLGGVSPLDVLAILSMTDSFRSLPLRLNKRPN
jgi:hypothetical protein